MSQAQAPSTPPDARHVRRWRGYLADERAEAAVYRDLASRRTGEEQAILLGLVQAEERHEQHWLDLLGAAGDRPTRVSLRTRLLCFLARNVGSVFVLALMQRAESRTPYDDDEHATDAMAADERVHEEIVRGLAARGRSRLSGSFRAAVFGINDGLVSNLALVLGMSATGVGSGVVLASGVAGLLSGALSMGAGEYVSVRSQRELLEASTPSLSTRSIAPRLDIETNELTLVYRARGMSERDAAEHAHEVLFDLECRHGLASPTVGGADAGSGDGVASPTGGDSPIEHEELGTAWGAATSSFVLFASGALIPVLPYLFGMTGLAAVFLAAGLVGLALLGTGAAVGLLSGASPLLRGLRQLAIGLGAAAVTYALGLLFGTAVG